MVKYCYSFCLESYWLLRLNKILNTNKKIFLFKIYTIFIYFCFKYFWNNTVKVPFPAREKSVPSFFTFTRERASFAKKWAWAYREESWLISMLKFTVSRSRSRKSLFTVRYGASRSRAENETSTVSCVFWLSTHILYWILTQVNKNTWS